ncbi:MAG TPA: hypothetical protein VI454_06895 [Verrucomicrobiae bacterium]
MDEKTPEETRTLAVSVEMGLTGNANFPAANPSGADVGAAVATYDTAVANTAAGLAAQAIIETAEATALEGVREVLRGAKKDCEKVSKGDRDMLVSANLPIKGESAPVGELARPGNFTVSTGDHTGEADGHCNKVRGASSYKGEYATNAAGPWTPAYSGTKSKFTMTGLGLGIVHYFRMAALGASGWSEWSDLAECRIV